MGTILETREIKVHGHKYSTTGVFGHKGKKKKRKANTLGPSDRYTYGHQARAKPNACTQKIATRLRMGKGRRWLKTAWTPPLKFQVGST